MLVNPGAWSGKRVLVTGHTGFKGGWLSLWLHRLGADVTGLALDPPTEPSFFEQTRLQDLVRHEIVDVRDCAQTEALIAAVRPEIVFHLAAQPLVRYSYDHPVETYATNVMGTVHVLEACRKAGGVKAAVCITTDKCYENREWVWPYRENDPMGGYDPYSSSKGAAELIIRRAAPAKSPKSGVATAFNFGPSDDDTQPVSWVVDRMLQSWGGGEWTKPEGAQPHEATLLRLDCSKARAELGWRPRFRLQDALDKVVEWHKNVASGGDARAISLAQIDDYMVRG